MQPSIWFVFLNLSIFEILNCVDCANLASSDDETETTTVGPYAVPDEEEPVTEAPRAMNMPKYLNKLGYLTDKQAEENNALAEDAFESAVREYQRFMNIKETGKLDAATLAHMKKPRCGNKDFDRSEFIDGKRALESESDRTKRFALIGNRWPKKLVTYKIATYPSSRRIKKRAVDLEIEKAFDAWSRVSPLTFHKRRGRVDIEIRFEKGAHGCKNNVFDRPQYDNVLAHAYGPGQNGLNGDVHFNDYYTWSMDPARGNVLYGTAVHEIGHSLGMLHSDHDEAIMYPTERNATSLHRDDIKGIQKIYGKKRTPKPEKEEGEEKAKETEKDKEEGEGEAEAEDEIEEGAEDEDHQSEKTDDNGDKSKSKQGAQHISRHRDANKPDCGSDKSRWLFSGPTCKQYYDCRSGTPRLRRCKGNLVWRKSENWCDFPHNVPECRVKYKN